MSEWISVNDKLPVGSDHLLACSNGMAKWMVVGYFNRLTRMWCIDGEMDPSMPVTHWQPLPDPPAPSQPTGEPTAPSPNSAPEEKP